MSISHQVVQSMREGAWIRRMFDEGIALKRQFGSENVFDFSLGNPITEPPPQFKEELRRLAEHPTPGMHRYMPNAGYPETRAAVAQQLAQETGLPFTGDNIVMTCGAGGGLNVILKAILNRGEEVVVFSPYFVEYLSYVDNHGGIPQVVPTDAQFNLDLVALERALQPSTKGVLINSPNNPTGVVYPKETLRALGELLRQKEGEYGTEIFLISDEPYRKLLYDGLKYPHVFHHHVRSLAVTSHSKDLALPGERIGYVAVHPAYQGQVDLLEALTYANRVLGFVNAPALMQHLVRRLQEVTVDIAEYQRKRDSLYQQLTAMGYSLVKPQGAFYLFPRTPIPDDVAFTRELQKRNILTVPGRGFGTPGHFRIAYCVDDRTIEGSMLGFQEVANAFGLRPNPPA